MRAPYVAAAALAALAAAPQARAQPTSQRPLRPAAARLAQQLERARALAEAGQLDRALQAYRRAAADHGDSGGPRAGAGRVLLRLGRAREAIDELRLVVELEEDVAEHWSLLGDACAAVRDWPCAGSSYLRALRLAPDRRAARGVDALGNRAFAGGYPFAPGEPAVDSLHPGRGPGLAISLGIGVLHAGFGVDACWTFRAPEQPFGVAPCAAVGSVTIDGDVGAAASLLLSAGDIDHWLLHVGYAALETRRLLFYGEEVARRVVYGVAAGVGRQWFYESGVFLRASFGASFPIDTYVDALDDASLALDLAVGLRP